MVASLKGRLTMYCLHLVGTTVYFLLNDGLEKGEVNNAVFISYWDHNLESAKGWWPQCSVCILQGL